MSRAVVLAVGVALLIGGAAFAAPDREVVFRTMPGGATVLDETGRVVAQAPEEAESTYRFPADAAIEHTYRLKRRRFIDLTVDLRWVHGWEYSCESLSGYLEPATRFDFARAVRFNGVPSTVNVSMGTVASHARTVSVGGVTHRVVPLRQTEDGLYVVPHAFTPPLLYLDGDDIEPRALLLKAGELDTDDVVVPPTPIELQPSRAHVMRRVALGAAAAIGVIAVLGFLLWRRRRAPVVVTELAETGMGPDSLPPGSIVSTAMGAFRLGHIVGRGGMGVVYEASAVDAPDALPTWAVKVLQGDAVERFRREIEICSRLQHPNIVKILDWGSIPTPSAAVPFLVMELVRGKTLRAALEQPLPLDTVWRLGQDVLKGLRAAHGMGVVHRDLKPENIMFTSSGNAKIMDFGIARTFSANRLTSTQAVMGTPAYLSPEHFNAGAATAASDLFSLGIILFEVLTGKHPWDLDKIEIQSMYVILGRLLSMPPADLRTLRPDVPVGMAAVVQRLMEADPKRRYSTAEEALEDWSKGAPDTPIEPH